MSHEEAEEGRGAGAAGWSQQQRPYDSFTLMHHDLDVCTNSLQVSSTLNSFYICDVLKIAYYFVGYDIMNRLLSVCDAVRRGKQRGASRRARTSPNVGEACAHALPAAAAPRSGSSSSHTQAADTGNIIVASRDRLANCSFSRGLIEQ